MEIRKIETSTASNLTDRKVTIPFSGKTIANLTKSGRIHYDHFIQRGYVWSTAAKSDLIMSMLTGFPIPMVYAKRIGTGKDADYYILDGKQRLSTIAAFINNEFAMTETDETVIMESDEDGTMYEVNVSGAYFDELPNELKDMIKNYNVSLNYFEDMTAEEERILFKKLNSGKQLTAKSRLLASTSAIGDIVDLSDHNVFAEMLSEKSLENKNQFGIILKSWAMNNKSDVSFETRIFNSMIESEFEINDEEKSVLDKSFTLAKNIHDNLMEAGKKNVAKMLYKETHFVSLIPFFKKMIERNISVEDAATWVANFFEAEHTEYDMAAKTGANSKSAINTRFEKLAESFNATF